VIVIVVDKHIVNISTTENHPL